MNNARKHTGRSARSKAKDNCLKVYLDDEMLKQIAENASSRNMNRSEYARLLLSEKTPIWRRSDAANETRRKCELLALIAGQIRSLRDELKGQVPADVLLVIDVLLFQWYHALEAAAAEAPRVGNIVGGRDNAT